MGKEISKVLAAKDIKKGEFVFLDYNNQAHPLKDKESWSFGNVGCVGSNWFAGCKYDDRKCVVFHDGSTFDKKYLWATVLEAIDTDADGYSNYTKKAQVFWVDGINVDGMTNLKAVALGNFLFWLVWFNSITSSIESAVVDLSGSKASVIVSKTLVSNIRAYRSFSSYLNLQEYEMLDIVLADTNKIILTFADKNTSSINALAVNFTGTDLVTGTPLMVTSMNSSSLNGINIAKYGSGSVAIAFSDETSGVRIYICSYSDLIMASSSNIVVTVNPAKNVKIDNFGTEKLIVVWADPSNNYPYANAVLSGVVQTEYQFWALDVFGIFDVLFWNSYTGTPGGNTFQVVHGTGVSRIFFKDDGTWAAQNVDSNNGINGQTVITFYNDIAMWGFTILSYQTGSIQAYSIHSVLAGGNFGWSGGGGWRNVAYASTPVHCANTDRDIYVSAFRIYAASEVSGFTFENDSIVPIQNFLVDDNSVRSVCALDLNNILTAGYLTSPYRIPLILANKGSDGVFRQTDRIEFVHNVGVSPILKKIDNTRALVQIGTNFSFIVGIENKKLKAGSILPNNVYGNPVLFGNNLLLSKGNYFYKLTLVDDVFAEDLEYIRWTSWGVGEDGIVFVLDGTNQLMAMINSSSEIGTFVALLKLEGETIREIDRIPLSPADSSYWATQMADGTIIVSLTSSMLGNFEIRYDSVRECFDVRRSVDFKGGAGTRFSFGDYIAQIADNRFTFVRFPGMFYGLALEDCFAGNEFLVAHKGRFNNLLDKNDFRKIIYDVYRGRLYFTESWASGGLDLDVIGEFRGKDVILY